jgi:adenylate cyclase
VLRQMGADEEGTLANLSRRHRKDDSGWDLVEFASVVDAERCGRTPARYGNPKHVRAVGDRLDFRIGIYLGDIIVEDDDSLATRIAARLEGIGEWAGFAFQTTSQGQIRGKIDLSFQEAR